MGDRPGRAIRPWVARRAAPGRRRLPCPGALRRDGAAGRPAPGSGIGQGRTVPYLERFLSHGRLVTRGERYVIVEPVPIWAVRPGGGRGHRAIGCLGCGRLSWHPYDVEARFCPSCKEFLDRD